MSVSRETGMKRRAPALAVALATLVSPLSLSAAEWPVVPLRAGDRVRVSTSAAAEGMTGQLLDIGPDNLRLRLTGRPEPIDVPLASVTRLERSLGRRSHAGKGALVGGLLGVGVGATLVLLSGNWECDGPCTGYAIILGGGLVGTGALLGAIGGALVKTERWEVASLGRVGVSVAPRPRGAAVALSVRF